MPESLPVIDIAPLRKSTTDSRYHEASSELFAALSEIGFAIVIGHGVDPLITENMRRAVQAVFETPRDVLLRNMVAKGNYRGFVPLGYFTPNSGKGKADQYEAWKLHFETDVNDPIRQHCNLYAPNVWPSIDTDVQTPIMNYWHALDTVSEHLITALCIQLGVDPSVLMSCMSMPLTNMTLLNYPSVEPQADTWGIHPHKDFNLLTLLAHDPIGGLEVRNRSGEWMNAACPEDAMVLNVGDMLELWSGGRLVSTPHRVFNMSGQPRQSFPYFSKPRWDVVVQPLVEPLPNFDRAPLHVGTSAADIWYSNWPDTSSTDPTQDLGAFD